MPTRLRKTRRMRGSRTHGWGTSGQHRKSGMRGGHGRAGWCKHKWTYTVKYDLARIGKKGFTSTSSTRKPSTINLTGLEELAERFGVPGEGGKITVDLDKLGFRKLLGEGSVSKPYLVRVLQCSGKAREKIAQAGGEILSKLEAEVKA
ncbi:MAG: uL15 family ribosomal protein [Thermoproteota archaeon]